MVTIDIGDECLEEGENLLEALNKAQVFKVNKLEDGRFRFEESCDNWFYANLTKDQVFALSEELRALSLG